MRNKWKQLSMACFLVAAISVPQAVKAAAITINYTGSVVFYGPSLLPYGLSTFAPISGSITYEAATPDSLPGFPQNGAYGNAVTSFTYSVGTLNGSSVSGDIGIGNDLGAPSLEGDTFQALGTSTYAGLSGPANFDYQFRLKDFQATALTDDSLPVSGAFLGGGSFTGVSDQAFLTLFLSNGAFAGLSSGNLIIPQVGPIALIATFDSLSVAVVSEPLIFGFLAAGAAGLCWSNRCSRRRERTA